MLNTIATSNRSLNVPARAVIRWMGQQKRGSFLMITQSSMVSKTHIIDSLAIKEPYTAFLQSSETSNSAKRTPLDTFENFNPVVASSFGNYSDAG